MKNNSLVKKPRLPLTPSVLLGGPLYYRLPLSYDNAFYTQKTHNSLTKQKKRRF